MCASGLNSTTAIFSAQNRHAVAIAKYVAARAPPLVAGHERRVVSGACPDDCSSSCSSARAPTGRDPVPRSRAPGSTTSCARSRPSRAATSPRTSCSTCSRGSRRRASASSRRALGAGIVAAATPQECGRGGAPEVGGRGGRLAGVPALRGPRLLRYLRPTVDNSTTIFLLSIVDFTRPIGKSSSLVQMWVTTSCAPSFPALIQ